MVRKIIHHAHPAALTISGVSKVFKDKDGTGIEALTPVELEIKKGEFVSIVGPSGCGKSTLLRIIAGLETATAGEIQLNGNPISGTDAEVGLIFQQPTLFPWLTLEGNIKFGPKSRGVDITDEEVDGYLALTGLEGFKKAHPHKLSGGMMQRAAIARALANEPSVLLLDEPLGALDAFTRMKMQDEILNIRTRRETTMLMVTHDIDEAVYMSDRIVIMSDRPGRIKNIIDVDLETPRKRNSPSFTELRSRILKTFGFAKEFAQDFAI
jgi:NitT/TauT family transport system ATP-binding protein/sulfonate transport system ATP-binding protein